ncbi:Uncharacterized protein PBTT_03250 [Plasmodiophora brassicae]
MGDDVDWNDDFWDDGVKEDDAIVSAPEPVTSAPPLSPLPTALPVSSPSSSPSPQDEHHRTASSSGGGWGGWLSSAADMILAPEDRRPAAPTVSQADGPKWLKSVAAVLDDVKTTAGQSGRELLQVATEVIDKVKKPQEFPQPNSPSPTASDVHSRPSPSSPTVNEASSLNVPPPTAARSPTAVNVSSPSAPDHPTVMDTPTGWFSDALPDITTLAAESGQEISGMARASPAAPAREPSPPSSPLASLSASVPESPARGATFDDIQLPDEGDLIDAFLDDMHHPPSPSAQPGACGRPDEPQRRPNVSGSMPSTLDAESPLRRGVEQQPDDSLFPDVRSACVQVDFDRTFEEFGGAEAMRALDARGRDGFLQVQRSLSQGSSGIDRDATSTIKDVLDDLAAKHDPVTSSSLTERLARTLDLWATWHRSVLQAHVQPCKSDITDLCARAHVACTRSLAVLSVRVVQDLDAESGTWVGSVDAVNVAVELRALFQRFLGDLHHATEQTIDAVRRAAKGDGDVDDDVAVLRADIDLDASEAQCKFEDAIEALCPVLQSLHSAQGDFR